MIAKSMKLFNHDNGASQSARLNRAIYDASLRKFLDILANKAEALGKWFCKVNPLGLTAVPTVGT